MADQQQRRFLVTGATGFIGSRLVAALVERHGAPSVTAMTHRDAGGQLSDAERWLTEQGVKTIECDLLALPRRDLPRPQFDVVYHLAAFADTEAPAARFRVNDEGTLNLVRWLTPALAGKKFVYTGTLASVDRDRPSGSITEATPCSPKTPYGQTKLAGEEIVRTQAAEAGFQYVILRLCTIIGRGYRPNGMFGRCPDLLARNAFAARLNWPGRVSFLSINDVVRLLIAIPDMPPAANETFVVSNGENPAFDELLQTMADVLGIERRRIELPRWLWRAAAAVSWPLASASLAPRRLRTLCWRVSHIIDDGICADATRLNSISGDRYQSIRDALRETYAK